MIAPQSGSRKYIYDNQPFLIYWELTRACDLACQHCRASAQLARNPLELTEQECHTLLAQIKEFGQPHVVVTGGDPLKHPHMFSILEKAKELGVGISLSPSGTGTLSLEAFQRFKELDVQAVSLSLDGATAESHDNFRGVPGCWDMTMEAAEYARLSGMPLQINTLVAESTVDELPLIYEKVKELGIIRWSVFFLISVGRGTALKEVSPEKAEEIMSWLGKLQRVSPFNIKTTEAPHYRRVMVQELKSAGVRVPISSLPASRGFGIRDANGIMFISHKGDVYPSGFLPLKAGNVRKTHVVNIYRDSEVFQQVRDPEQFLGKCGRCEFRYLCGGSRARAFAFTGNALESDPLCPYQPPVRASREEAVALS